MGDKISEDEGVGMSWTKSKTGSNYQLLHCILHFSHHFQQELQKKSGDFQAAHHPSPLKGARGVAARNKSFKFLKSAPLGVFQTQRSHLIPAQAGMWIPGSAQVITALGYPENTGIETRSVHFV